MLKKYTSYKIFSLTETGDNKESPQKDIPSKKMINKLNSHKTLINQLKK
jgi:hypothetical protein